MAQADRHDLRRGVTGLRAALTPLPHRGDLVAAGVVPLALGVLLVNIRLDARWGTGIFLLLDVLACALVLALALLAPRESERPRPYQQVLLLAGLLLLLLALFRLAQVLGAHKPLGAAGSRMWVSGLLGLAAAWLVVARRSAVCALVAAIAAGVALISFVQWAFHPHGAATIRWVLLVVAIVLVLVALSQRDRHRRESVYLIDAAGLAVVVIGLTFIGAIVGLLTLLGVSGAAPGGGWKLVLLAAGLGLVAYAAVDREPGPAYVGVVVLGLFVALAGLPSVSGANLWFWPLALLAAGAAMVAAGLRPSRPLPPEPAPAAHPTEPLAGPGAARTTEP